MKKVVEDIHALNKIEATKLSLTTKVNGIKSSTFNPDLSNLTSSQINEISSEVLLAKTKIESFNAILQSEIECRQSIVEFLKSELDSHANHIATLQILRRDCENKMNDLTKSEKTVQAKLEGIKKYFIFRNPNT